MTRITFIGFGEAAQAMAAGLAAEKRGAVLTAYDPRLADPAAGPALMDRARAAGVRVVAGPTEAVADADLVLSLVSGSVAVSVARTVGPDLCKGQIYVDLNSISPDAKRAAGEALRSSGGDGDFVEGAVMARVPPLRHKTPILLAGVEAERAARTLNALGMACEAVGTGIGQASAVKMIRSVMVKGIEALLIESLTAAERAGVRERIVDSISATFPGIDWREQATYYIGRTREHGARRVTEMNESADTLVGLGMEAVLTRAIARTIADAHKKFTSAGVAGDATYVEFVAALAGDATMTNEAPA